MSYWDEPEPMSNVTRLSLFTLGVILGALLYLVVR